MITQNDYTAIKAVAAALDYMYVHTYCSDQQAKPHG
jgi:hypothetical protein